MDYQYYNTNSFYTYIYYFCKSLILIIIGSVCTILSFGLAIPFLIIVYSNLIESNFEYNRLLFKGITLRNILPLIIYSVLFHLVVFVYINVGLLYNGALLSVVRGLNILTLIELILLAMYAPKYLYYNNCKILNAVKQSLILANYKFGLSLMVLSALAVLFILVTVIFKGQFLLLSSTIIFLWQLISSKLFNKFIKEGEKS